MKRRRSLIILAVVALGHFGCPSADPAGAPDATLDGTAADTDATGSDAAWDDATGSDADADADLPPDVGLELDTTPGDAEADLDIAAETATDTALDVALDTVPDATTDTELDTIILDAGSETGTDVPPDAPLSQFNGLTGQALRDALQLFTEQPHTPLGYTAARDAMYAFGGIDDDNGRIGCIYTGRTVDTDGSRTPSDSCKRADGVAISCGFNTEHSWAKFYLRLYLTEFTPEYDAAEGDIHHLFPSDSTVNSKRWHFDFLDTGCLSDGSCAVDELSQLGLRPGVSGDPACPTGNLDKDKDCVMQVRPQRQGDIARAQFYMAVRYGMPVDDATEAALRAWNNADPPDVWERDRNDGAEAAQGNRNPFVDRPDFVALISDF